MLVRQNPTFTFMKKFLFFLTDFRIIAEMILFKVKVMQFKGNPKCSEFNSD